MAEAQPLLLDESFPSPVYVFLQDIRGVDASKSNHSADASDCTNSGAPFLAAPLPWALLLSCNPRHEGRRCVPTVQYHCMAPSFGSSEANERGQGYPGAYVPTDRVMRVPEVPWRSPAMACAPPHDGAAYCFELWHHTKADMKASVASVLLLATLVASSLAHICILAPDQVRFSSSPLDCGTQEAWSDPHSAEEQMSRAPETPRASSRMVIDEQHPCSAGHG